MITIALLTPASKAHTNSKAASPQNMSHKEWLKESEYIKVPLLKHENIHLCQNYSLLQQWLHQQWPLKTNEELYGGDRKFLYRYLACQHIHFADMVKEKGLKQDENHEIEKQELRNQVGPGAPHHLLFLLVPFHA